MGEAAHTPYGNVSKMPLYSNWVLGQKRYELTNHLGNVMAVVTDKITEEPATPNATLPTIGIRRASLFAAYDYYPFGMLMPNRYIEDASEQCTPVTRNIFTKQQISVNNVHFKAQADMGIFVPVQGTGLEFTISETDAPGKMLVYAEEGEDVSVSMLLSGGNVQAETEVRIQTQVSNHNYEMPMVVELRQQNVNTQEWEVITSQEMSREGFMELTGTAINSTPFKLVFSAGGYANASFDVHGVDYYILDVVTHSYTYIECNRDQDAEVKDYRFGWQGKFEKNDEISGSGNHIDWGGYGYDTRLAKRWSADKLHAKYSWQSPYSAVGNNPILNQEIDGKDYAVFVDHKTKTVIIKATYYTAKGKTDDYTSAVKATQFWNEQSGKYQYKVGKGKEAVYYDVNFQLDVQQVDNPRQQATIDKYPLTGQTPLVTDGSSNTYEVVPDSDLDARTNGVTTGGNVVEVKESRKETNTGAHEQGHTLGFGHLINSIMSAASNVGREETVNTTIVGQILKKAGLGRMNFQSDYQGDGTGNLQVSTGNTPRNFNKGKVVKKRR